MRPQLRPDTANFATRPHRCFPVRGAEVGGDAPYQIAVDNGSKREGLAADGVRHRIPRPLVITVYTIYMFLTSLAFLHNIISGNYELAKSL